MKNHCILFIILCISLYNTKCQNSDVTFEKSHHRYKIKNYLYNDPNNELKVIDFKLEYKKCSGKNKGIAYDSISFGCRRKDCYLPILFSQDTIFYLPKNIKEPLFILNESTKNDTIYIKDFGAIHDHNILFEKKYYYSSIKDTIYVFKLWHPEINPKQYPYINSSSELNYLYFNKVAISKRYGFVWINFREHGIEVEVRYY